MDINFNKNEDSLKLKVAELKKKLLNHYKNNISDRIFIAVIKKPRLEHRGFKGQKLKIIRINNNPQQQSKYTKKGIYKKELLFYIEFKY